MSEMQQDSRSRIPPTQTLSRLNHAMGPVVAGMIIDAVDFVTFGPVGLVLGLPVGGLAGYWLGHSLRLDKNACWFCALVAGIYCTIPFTELLPLGTIVGALTRFQSSEADPPRESSDGTDGNTPSHAYEAQSPQNDVA